MKRLPVEILIAMFSLLHQSDQVECMTVCKKWGSTIKSSCLFRTLHLTSIKQIEKLKKLFEQESSQGEPVERLVISTVLNLSLDLEPFLKLIPNPLVVFMPTGTRIISIKSDWNNYVGFYELNSHHITYQLLQSGVCSRLESIMVCGYGMDICTSTFIDALKNAPALKKLRMDRSSISLENLELLHINVPTLCSLDLEPVSLLRHLTLPVTEIIPMTSLTSLSIYLCSLEDTTNVTSLIQYVNRKYSRLSKFSTWPANDLGYGNERKIYQNGLAPLLQTYGPTLKEMAMFLKVSPQELFNTLENISYHLRSLKIQLISYNWNSQLLENKSHLQHLQTLKLLGISFISDFNCLKGYITLKELELTFSDYSFTMERYRTVSVNKLLESCPDTLESITLANVRFIHEPSSIPVLPFVKKLEIRYSNPIIGLDSFLSKALPKLRFLRFDHCNLAYKHFSFPDLDLDYLDISGIFVIGKNNLLVTTLRENFTDWL